MKGNDMTTLKEHPPAKLTGRKYDSVEALMRGEGVSTSVQEKVEKFARETRLSLHLAKLRQKAGITQKEMADALKVTQSAISKLEAGTDEHITLHHVQEYSRITGSRINLFFGKPFSDEEALSMLIDSLKERLEKLAGAAHNQDSKDKVKVFFGDACQQILQAVLLCNCKLPIDENDHIQEMRVEIISGKKVIPPNESAATVKTTRLQKA
jgi:transcriptional regulator with XRE-family HTH domain